MIEIMELDILKVKTIFVWFSCYLCRESDRIFQLIFFFSLFDASLFPPRTTNVVLVIVRRRVLSPGNETTMYSSYIDFFQDNNITIQLLQSSCYFFWTIENNNSIVFELFCLTDCHFSWTIFPNNIQYSII